MRTFNIGNVKIGSGLPVIIAGPCVIETAEHTVKMAEKINRICSDNGFDHIFKVSYDKANRTSHESYRGPGIKEGLTIIEKIKNKLNIPVLVDVHTPKEAKAAAKIVDCLQIPAFLCRQTDFVQAAADQKIPVNVKKGQFLAPWDMENIIKKIEARGNNMITLTERGTSFGYNNLVVDFRSLVIMQKTDYPVIFDATHSVQMPGGLGAATGGDSSFVPYLVRAAAAIGVQGIFMEVHDCPSQALCDGPNQLNISKLDILLKQVKLINQSLALEGNL
jgi:2-dehydro-3-deoxyphosphooctonate aldolase (KDO 8-P synthase)